MNLSENISEVRHVSSKNMGIRKSKLKRQDLDLLLRCTRFNKEEIQDWHRGFMQSCPSGLVSCADFEMMYADSFDGDASEFSHHVFRSFDVDGSGYIDFKEFLQSLSVTSRGSLDEKLEWAFRIYDVDGDGFISKQEMRQVVRAIYKMYPDDELVKKDSAEARADKVFENFDEDHDGKLTLEEFKRGARNDPFIVLLMQYKRQRKQIDSKSQGAGHPQ